MGNTRTDARFVAEVSLGPRAPTTTILIVVSTGRGRTCSSSPARACGVWARMINRAVLNISDSNSEVLGIPFHNSYKSYHLNIAFMTKSEIRARRERRDNHTHHSQFSSMQRQARKASSHPPCVRTQESETERD